jgi:hypothetical protein
MRTQIAIAAFLLSGSLAAPENTKGWFQDGTFSALKKNVIEAYGIGTWGRLEKTFSIRRIEDKTSRSGKQYVRASACVPHNCAQQATAWVQTTSGKVMAVCFMEGFPDANDHTIQWVGKPEAGGNIWSETRVNLIEDEESPCDSYPPGWTGG